MLKVMRLSLTYCDMRCALKGILITINDTGARGGAVVKALRYKPEGYGIDSRWSNWYFSMT
jgi:hypothetical protein